MRKEAQAFKANSRHAVDVLKSENLSVEAYTEALALMQEMAEDIYISGPGAVEYWVRQYIERQQLRMPGTPTLEEVLGESRCRAKREELPYQFQFVDWTKL